ncbi:MAG: 16S rRNA (uracil(1498)-N(3))-methyltransferase [Verrucomicrobia bacterium]|nr:MAG: 16S rRNA (uracil(1498)-N(3))-methyltransferase [Verrucomicrobiota bacterium]
MARFFLPPEHWQTGALLGDEAHHLSQVLRIQTGAVITLFDGEGKSAQAEVLAVAKRRIDLKMQASEFEQPELPRLTLAQAIPKGKNMDWIVQKAVELGVTDIQPLLTDHTIVKPADLKAEKWQRVAIEACKQCGQNFLPRIHSPLTLTAWIQSLHDKPISTRIIASLASGSRPLREVLREQPASHITLLIGPEGDFSLRETKLALTENFHPASLGLRVLRVETATLFAISAVRYECMK